MKKLIVLLSIFVLASSCEEPPPKKEYHEEIWTQHSAFWTENRGISFLCTSNQEENLNENDRTQVMYFIMQPKDEWRDWSSEKEPYEFRSSFIYKIFEFKEEAESMRIFWGLNDDFLNGMASTPEIPTRMNQIDYKKKVPAFSIFQRIDQGYLSRSLEIKTQDLVSSRFTSNKSLYARKYKIKINRESLDFFIKPDIYEGSNGDWVITKFTRGGSCKISNNIEIKKALTELSKRASAKKIEFEIKKKQAQEEELKKLNQENTKQLEKNQI